MAHRLPSRHSLAFGATLRSPLVRLVSCFLFNSKSIQVFACRLNASCGRCRPRQLFHPAPPARCGGGAVWCRARTQPCREIMRFVGLSCGRMVDHLFMGSCGLFAFCFTLMSRVFLHGRVVACRPRHCWLIAPSRGIAQSGLDHSSVSGDRDVSCAPWLGHLPHGNTPPSFHVSSILERAGHADAHSLAFVAIHRRSMGRAGYDPTSSSRVADERLAAASPIGTSTCVCEDPKVRSSVFLCQRSPA